MCEMNREAEQALRGAFRTWMHARASVAGVTDAAAREELVIQAEELADRWEASAWCEEWQYLTGLVQGWIRSPQTMRTVTAAAQAGDLDLTEVEVRSLTQVWLIMDPREAGRQGWQRMQDRVSELNGTLAAAIEAGAPQEVLDSLERRMDLWFDWPGQPLEWRDYDQQVQGDTVFWEAQNELFDAAAAHPTEA